MADDFNVRPSALAGLRVVGRLRKGDTRGFLSRFYCRDAFAELGWTDPIAQINHTRTSQAGAIRGMHFQRAPHAEDKFVSCLAGAVFDVAVDLRPDSPTYLQWHGEILSAENHVSLLIPKGFAHGFQTLTPDCEMLYLHSHSYAPESEGGVHPLDPALAIAWPDPVTMMSDRDKSHPFIDEGL